MRLIYFPPFLILLAMLPALLAYRVMDPRWRPPLWVFGLRWFLGLLFAFSGLAKLVPGFPNTMGPVNLEGSLAPHGLALLARFVAVAEVAAGLLLLSRRFATIGALMLFPMILTILLVTVSLQWRGTPYVNAVFLGMNLALLAYDWPKIAPLIGERPAETGPRWPAGSEMMWAAVLGGALLLLAVIRIPQADAAMVALVGTVAAVLVIAEWRGRGK